jgi:sporulation protein YlmC with PRC-barrel domain
MLRLLSIVTALWLALSVSPAAAQQRSTPQEQVALNGLPVYSSDGKQIGKVIQVRVADGQVNAVRAELSGNLGIGEKTIEIPAARFKSSADRIVLSMTAEEAGKLPAVK